MDFLTKIKDKIDSTKEYFSNKFTDNKKDSQQQFENLVRDKEINFNQEESKKVNYIKSPIGYDFEILINGKSIFENLILTAHASKKGEQIPIKCHWKRIYEESVITIQNTNSSSYIPNAEDIGYKIEVEVCPFDNPDDIAIAQYGPIIIDKDMENAIELFLTSGKNFNLYLFDEKTQEKIKDKEYILYLKNDELLLSHFDSKWLKFISLSFPKLSYCCSESIAESINLFAKYSFVESILSFIFVKNSIKIFFNFV